jgi:nucleoside-diphosphate-sugar epimerase
MSIDKSYLITGATGFIGFEFLKHLIKFVPEKNITCIVRKTSNYERLLALDVKVFIGDIQKPTEFADELLDSNYVYHFAANSSFKNNGNYYNNNILATEGIVNILKDSRKLILFFFASTIGAVDRKRMMKKFIPLNEQSSEYPRSNYGKSKLKSEKLVIASNLPYIILRITWAYGPGMRLNSHISTFIADVNKKKFYTNIMYPGKVSLIYISDLVSGIWYLTNRDGAENNIYFISDSKPVSLGKIFKQIQLDLHSESKMIALPWWIIKFIKLLSPLLPFTISVLVNDSYVCSSKKITSIGFESATNYKMGINNTIKWIQDQKIC